MSYIKKKLSRKDRLDEKAKKKPRQNAGNSRSQSMRISLPIFDRLAEETFWEGQRVRNEREREIRAEAARNVRNARIFDESRITIIGQE